MIDTNTNTNTNTKSIKTQILVNTKSCSKPFSIQVGRLITHHSQKKDCKVEINRKTEKKLEKCRKTKKTEKQKKTIQVGRLITHHSQKKDCKNGKEQHNAK